MRGIHWRWAIAVLPFLWVGMAQAQKIYQWTDEKGQVHFSQRPPPEGVQAETRQLKNNEPSETRRAYCLVIQQIGNSIAAARLRGVPADQVNNDMRQVELRYDVDVNEIALRELVNYVYQSTRAGVYDQTISNRILDACLGGAFGNLGRSQKQTADADAEGEAQDIPGSSSGTGWVTHGLVATNYHVIAGKSDIEVHFPNGRSVSASVRASDPENDVALLSLRGETLPPGLPIASGEAGVGAEVFTLGYPHTSIMGSNAKLTTGIINSTTGMRDDARVYQISVPVQSGNSGGPLINMRGEVVGLVTAKLSAAHVYRWTGDMPQNVNYAVKVGYLTSLLPHGESPASIEVGEANLETLGARVRESVVRITAE